jgi:predicted nucleic acid-binding protein
MTHYFLDSSALIKRYIPEPGTHWVRTSTAPGSGHTVFIAHITPIEMVSGLNRRAREGHLSSAHAYAIRQVLDRYADSQYVGIGFNHQIAARAKDLLERHALRAYDSVQLASALEANAMLVSSGLSPLVFVCADNRLTAVAAVEGLATDTPNNHP